MEPWFAQLIQMSITGSYCILVVILARLLLRKIPALFSYALWSIVLFRLICPFSFESPISFIPADTQRIPLTPAAAEASIPDMRGAFQASSELQVPKPQRQTSDAGTPTQGMKTPAQTPAASTEPAAGTFASNPWMKTIQYLWLVGTGVMIIHSIVATIRLKRSLKSAQHISGNLYQSKQITTPFVIGLLKPRIYLPAGLQEQEKTYIIKHEQVHIRRLDHLIKPVAFAVLCLHWFNPLVWLAFYLMSEDMEKSCDESVIRQLGSGIKQDYSLSLLALSSGRRFTYRSPLAFGENGTKGRIRNILQYRKPAFWVVLLCIAGISSLGVGLLGNPKQQAESVEHTAREYAQQFINTVITSYSTRVPDLTFKEPVITKWEQIGEYDKLLDIPVSLWALEYRLKPENTDLLKQLGDVSVEEGMLTEEGGMGKPMLVFSYKDSVADYLGVIRDGEHDMTSPAGQEMALRVFLEEKGQLPHETFSGQHVLVQFPLTTGETSQLLLSQPVKQGDAGIWTVERWKDTNGNEYYHTPQTEKTLEAYYADQQSGAEQGKDASLFDPVEVAVQYIKTDLGQPVSRDKLVVNYEATSADFAVTPESRLTGYVTGLAMNTDSLDFDQVEWLTLADADRFAALNIKADDLPGGFYILNKYEINDPYKVTPETEYKLVNREQPGTYTSVSKQDFIRYFGQLTDLAPPCTITISKGTVNSITEVYLP
ncbi:M56 family metallopeptidase [Paenibacillus sp. FSL K6-1217]|uniref:M56 family metallopeptidase n=1 Tax=Paenibacillus sp. FSL K6-1217 TaxID=2921466 RepID=UPI0032540DC4